MLPPGAIFELKIHQNAYAAEASPRTALKGDYRAPRPPSWFSGSHFAVGEGRKGEVREGRRKREGYRIL